MVATFDHRDTGTSPARWDAVVAAAPALDLPGPATRLVVLAAHPDDETLGAGGTIATASTNGHVVDVVIATDGEASHPRSADQDRSALAAVRRREAAEAVAVLAPRASVTFLGLPDGELSTRVPGITESLIRIVASDRAWLLSPWLDDRHPDHRACALAARAVAAQSSAVRALEYPIWAWHWADPDDDDIPRAALRRILIEPAAVDARRRALDRYVSQTHPRSDEPKEEAVVSAAFAAHFERPFDVLVDPVAAPDEFARLYAMADDPWDLGGRWYERRKRAVLLAALPRERFGRAFEPGCATGLLTAELADRADHVLAVDVADRAVAQTRARLRTRPHVEVARMRIPDEWPADRFDLIVLSEMGYYVANLAALAGRIHDTLAADGIVVLCHWRHPASAHAQSAETVHEAMRAEFYAIAQHVEEDFLLDVLTADPDGTSVARVEGIVR